MTLDLETWKNATPALISLQRVAPNGVVKHEIVRGGATFKISGREREITHTVSSTEVGDPFMNGTLLYQGGGDRDSIPASPNRLTDVEIDAILNADTNVARNQLEALTAPAILERIYARALSTDVGERRMTMIQERLTTLDQRRILPNRSVRAALPIDYDDDGPGPTLDIPIPPMAAGLLN